MSIIQNQERAGRESSEKCMNISTRAHERRGSIWNVTGCALGDAHTSSTYVLLLGKIGDDKKSDEKKTYIRSGLFLDDEMTPYLPYLTQLTSSSSRSTRRNLFSAEKIHESDI
jgi:hypothetical protein